MDSPPTHRRECENVLLASMTKGTTMPLPRSRASVPVPDDAGRAVAPVLPVPMVAPARRSGSRRHRALLAAGVAVLCALTACTAVSSSDPTGTWGSTQEHHPHLIFTDDHLVSGNDGCNELSGEWSLDGEVVVIGTLASTLMYCLNVDTWLRNAASAQVDGSTLHVFDASGSEIGSLTRG